MSGHTPWSEIKHKGEERCHYCGLINPGPEHLAYAPSLCAERPIDTGMGDRERPEDVYTPRGLALYRLIKARQSHWACCSMCNGEWNDGPCMVGVGITAGIDYLG